MVRRGDIGCLELLDHFIARVERLNPQLNAVVVQATTTAPASAPACWTARAAICAARCTACR